MLNPLDSVWTIGGFLFLVAAALDDLKRMEIDPIFYKLAFVCVLLAAWPTSFWTAAAMGLVFYCVGVAAYYLKMWGGADAKLMLPVGALIAYLQIHWITYLGFLVFTSMMWLILQGCLLMLTRNYKRYVPFTPIYPLSITLSYIVLKSVGF